MESRNDRERYVTNPLRLLRGVVELVLTKVDDALDVDFEPMQRIYPTTVEAPVATEEELMNEATFGQNTL